MHAEFLERDIASMAHVEVEQKLPISAHPLRTPRRFVQCDGIFKTWHDYGTIVVTCLDVWRNKITSCSTREAP